MRTKTRTFLVFAAIAVYAFFVTATLFLSDAQAADGVAKPQQVQVFSLDHNAGNGTNYVATMSTSGTPTGGSVSLKLGSNITGRIAWGSPTPFGARIQSELNKFGSIGPDGVVVTQNGTDQIITFSGPRVAKLNVGLLTVISNLTGGATATLATTAAGVTADGRNAEVGAVAVNFLNGNSYWTTAAGPNVNWRKFINAPTPTPTSTPTPTATPTPTPTPTPTTP